MQKPQKISSQCVTVDQRWINKELTDRSRAVPLQDVLLELGAEPDDRDRHKWKTQAGPVSIREEKFYMWHQGRGGGGAIDLVMTILETDFMTAKQWLVNHFYMESLQPNSVSRVALPTRDDSKLPRVIAYLTVSRGIPRNLVENLVYRDIVFADARNNAVFVLLGKENLPVGAELRSTGPQVWRGMTPGSMKHRGFFYIGDPASKLCVICESAIDAISCHVMNPECLCISTSGVTPSPYYLPILLHRGYRIWCGFDNDDVGNVVAEKMIHTFPGVKRLLTKRKDWNEELLAQ